MNEFRLYEALYIEDGEEKSISYRAASPHHAKMIALDMYDIKLETMTKIRLHPSDNKKNVAKAERRKSLPDCTKFGKQIDIVDFKTGERYFTSTSKFGGESLLLNIMRYIALNGFRFIKLEERQGKFTAAYVTPVSESIYDWDKVFDPNKAVT